MGCEAGSRVSAGADREAVEQQLQWVKPVDKAWWRGPDPEVVEQVSG
ncbi:hypothetical protein HRH25_09060 [Flavisolibacter sp. BT320]|nr:hypothetical protein [Flavisolibacter longurius]